MRYSVVEEDVTAANARGLREAANEREAAEDPVARQIRLRGGSGTAPPRAQPLRLNRRRLPRRREQLSTRRRPRLNYHS